MVWALLDGLRGHARAVLATSLLHMLAHLYLADDRHEDGHHAGVSGRGIMPPPTSLGALIERVQTPYRTHERPRVVSWCGHSAGA